MHRQEVMNNDSLSTSDPLLVREWGSDTFHRRVIELEANGYVARQETYSIVPEMNPETGEVIHLYTIEMLKRGPSQDGPQ